MHIEVSAKSLSTAAATAARVAGKKMAVAPVYHHVLLEASAEGLTLTALDDRMWIRRRAEVEHIHRPGAVCIPADTLAALASRIMPAAVVTLEHDEESGKVSISFGRARHELPCLPADEFPPIESDDYDAEMSACSDDIAQALARSYPFADKDGAATNYRMNGVRIREMDGQLEVIGGSPRHISRTPCSMTGSVVPVTIPESVVPIISTVIGAEYDPVLISTSTRKVKISCAGVEIVSRLIDEEYPDVDLVESHLTYGASFRVDPSEVQSALDRVKILAEADPKAARIRNIHIQADKDTLYVYSSIGCVEQISIWDFSGTEGLGMSIADADLQKLLGAVADEARFFIAEEGQFAARIVNADHPQLGRAFCMGLRIHRPEITG